MEWDRCNKKERYSREIKEEESYEVYSYNLLCLDDDNELSGEGDLEDPESSVEDYIIRQMKDREVRKAIMMLPPDEKAYILNRFFNEAVPTQIAYAQQIGISGNGVYSLKKRAFRHLRSALKKNAIFDD